MFSNPDTAVELLDAWRSRVQIPGVTGQSIPLSRLLIPGA